MNTFNTTLVSPEWAAKSYLDDDGNILVHEGPELSDDPLVTASISRLDLLREDNTYGDSGWSISVRGDENVQINLDYDTRSRGMKPAEHARRLAKQLLIAADAMDEATR